MKAYKGFDKDLRCRGFQYEIGKEYEEKEAKLCEKGFHACEYPLDCFGYYSPATSRFCEVDIECEESDKKQSSDTKVCGKKIKIGAELDIKEIVRAAFEYTKEHCTNSDKGGNRSALTGGDCSALTGGGRSVVYGGDGAKVRAGKGSVLALQYWKRGRLVGIKFKEVDGEKIKAGTWYKLDKAGKFIKATDGEVEKG